MSPPSVPPDASADDVSTEDVLFALMLQVLERALDLAASADRGSRLGELTRLTADIDLFALAAMRAAAYVPSR